MLGHPFEGQWVIVDASSRLAGGDPMDPNDCLVCQVIGPAKGLHDLRVMYGSPAAGFAYSWDVDLNDVIPINNQLD